MSNPESTPTFDAASAASALLGTWHVAMPDSSPGDGWLHFFPDGRAIQMALYTAQPGCRVVHRLWFTVESATRLRFRPKEDQKGWLREYCFDGDSDAMALSAEDVAFPCKRVRQEALPDWFDDALRAEAARMASSMACSSPGI